MGRRARTWDPKALDRAARQLAAGYSLNTVCLSHDVSAGALEKAVKKHKGMKWWRENVSRLDGKEAA